MIMSYATKQLILQHLLSKYTSSFTEKIVDNYVDMVNEF